MRVRRVPNPPAGTAIRTRTGKDRSASEIISFELAAILFPYCSTNGSYRQPRADATPTAPATPETAPASLPGGAAEDVDGECEGDHGQDQRGTLPEAQRVALDQRPPARRCRR